MCMICYVVQTGAISDNEFCDRVLSDTAQLYNESTPINIMLPSCVYIPPHILETVLSSIY